MRGAANVNVQIIKKQPSRTATSHADVIRNFDLASSAQYTNSNGNNGDGSGNSDVSNSISSSSSSSGSSSSNGGNTVSSISNINSMSPYLTSSSATLFASSPLSAISSSALVQAEAPSLETFVSAASTSAFVEPYLDGYATTNVTTQIGTHAYLPCRVSVCYFRGELVFLFYCYYRNLFFLLLLSEIQFTAIFVSIDEA